jgi:hypothetical protein
MLESLPGLALATLPIWFVWYLWIESFYLIRRSLRILRRIQGRKGEGRDKRPL